MKSKNRFTKKWTATTIEKFCPFVYGKGLPARERNNNGKIPVYGSNGIIGYHDKALINSHSVIIGRKGTIGATHFSKKTCWPIDTTFYIYPKKNIEMRFVYYLLKNLHLDKMDSDTAVPGLNRNRAHEISIKVPDYDEQLSISTTLGGLDDKIILLKKSNKFLEQTLMSIFGSWFIAFENQKNLVQSELGNIPQGWKVVSIGRLANFIKGFSYKGVEKFHSPAEYIFVTLNNIKEGGSFKPEYTWIESDRLKERHFLKEGDLIIANTEQTKDGRLLTTPAMVFFYYDYQKKKGVYSHHITKIIPKKKNLKFFLFALFYYKHHDFAKSYHTGTGVWGFDYKNFQEHFITICPSNDILERFESIGEIFFKKIFDNEKQIQILIKIRNLLLSKLISGEIRV